MAQKKKKDPWGSAAPNPFSSTHNEVLNDAAAPAGPPGIDWGPILDGTNRRRNMEKGMREGFVMAEDGSMVPRSFYGSSGGGSQNPYGNVGGRGGGGGPCKPGYVMAEDGTCVPLSFYANDPRYADRVKAIEW